VLAIVAKLNFLDRLSPVPVSRHPALEKCADIIGGEMPNRQLLEPPPVNDPSRHGLSFSGSREKADFPAALVGRANPARRLTAPV
jgi:hypothetical protein